MTRLNHARARVMLHDAGAAIQVDPSRETDAAPLALGWADPLGVTAGGSDKPDAADLPVLAGDLGP